MTIHDDLERDEGRRTKVYKCTADKNTIGKGRNLDDVPLTAEEEAHLGCTTADLLAGKALDNAQIDYLFENDLRRVEKDLDRHLAWWRGRPESVQRGLMNMAFQLGIHGLLGFKKMLACLHAGDYEGARRHAADSKWAREDTPARAARVTALFTAGHPFS